LKRIQQGVLAAAVLAAILGFWLFRQSPGAVAARASAARRADALEPVATGTPRTSLGLEIEAREVQRLPVRRSAKVAAVLEPAHRVELAAEVEGRVVEIVTEEHRAVEAGDVLLRLEEGFLAAAVLRADGGLKRALANAELAGLDLERQRGLAKQKVASRAELDRAVSERRARDADVTEARGALADARLRLSKAEIRAPFAGFVEHLDLEPGAYVRVGEIVAHVLDVSEIDVEVGLTDREVVALAPGDPVHLEVDVFPGETFAGVVTGVASAVDPESQKYPVDVRIPNAEQRLRAGMLGSVRFELGDAEPAIRIPRRATQSEFEVARRRRVALRRVPFRPELAEVVSGLRPGERIALSRIRELRDGLPVHVKGQSL
jgi:RND family efflux transporter MFP subunit